MPPRISAIATTSLKPKPDSLNGGHVDNDPVPDDESIGELIGRLVEDAKAFGRAEVAYYRTIASERLTGARTGLILVLAAVLLVVAAAIALILGLLLILQACVGPIWATVIVVLGTIAVAALLGWIGYGKIRSVLARPLQPGDQA